MRGSSDSPYSLGERRERAFKMYSRGRTNKDVMEDLQVSEDTAGRYRQLYETNIRRIAAANPGLLRDVLQNTIQQLGELDQVRTEAWTNYESAATGSLKASYLSLIAKVQDQRAKLYGLFGVKHEYFVMVQQVHEVQVRLIQFMRRELCADDRRKLESFMTNDLAGYIDDTQILDEFPALPPASLEE